MTARHAKSIGRLVEMKRRKSDAAEAAHAAARSAMEATAQTKSEAERRWLAALDAHDHIGNVADLEIRDVLVRSLRRAVDEADRRLRVASAHEATARAAMTDARVELRRFETWLERQAEAAANEGRRVERIAEDEVAARGRRAG